MKYAIKYHYRTGDSFHSEDITTILEYEWENFEIAKEALQRIKEHYEWYKLIEDTPYKHRSKVKKPKWWDVNLPHSDEDIQHNIINLRMDNGVEVQFWAPWCGYFETLYSASIVNQDRDGDLSFTV